MIKRKETMFPEMSSSFFKTESINCPISGKEEDDANGLKPAINSAVNSPLSFSVPLKKDSCGKKE